MKWDLVERLRGRYRIGPHQPNGPPEFGWRQWQATPINLEAAEAIEELREALRNHAYQHRPPRGLECTLCWQAVDLERRVGHRPTCLLFVPPVELTEEQRRKDDDATAEASE